VNFFLAKKASPVRFFASASLRSRSAAVSAAAGAGAAAAAGAAADADAAAGERPIFGTGASLVAVELGSREVDEGALGALRQASVLHAVDAEFCDLEGLARLYGGARLGGKIMLIGLANLGEEADDFGLPALLRARDWEALANAAHRLRGAAQYFASRAATAAAGRLGVLAHAAQSGGADAEASAAAAADSLTSALHEMEAHARRAIDALASLDAANDAANDADDDAAAPAPA